MWLKLTRVDGTSEKVQLVNDKHILSIFEYNGKTIVAFDDLSRVEVKETFDELWAQLAQQKV